MSGWQTLDLITFGGDLSVERGALMVDKTRVPLSSVSMIMVGPDCRCGFGLAHHAAKFDVAVIFCDWKGIPVSTLLPWSENGRVCARHRAQAALTEPRRKNAWMRVIKAKIAAQANTLAGFGYRDESFRLNEQSRRVRSGDPDNLEAQSARFYWTVLFPEEEFGRRPEASDFQNAALNYGYTLLRGRVISAIVASGLSPTLGIFHRGRSNAFALADDLIEPFRAVVDRAVRQLPRDQTQLSPEVKRYLVSVVKPEEPLLPGRALGTEIERLASSYADYVEGRTAVLKVPVI